jgi:crossover junction endodeoxyribonuclease RuvC
VTTVVGIDPSLTAAGVAIVSHPSIAGTPNRPVLRTLGAGGTRSDGLVDRALRVGEQSRRIWAALPASTSLVVIEGLPMHKPPGASWYVERGAVILQLTAALARRRIPVVEVNLSTLKLWATGDGHADRGKPNKPMMMAAMRELWPHAAISNGNEADALALASLGGQRLGWYEPELPHHYSPNVAWPKGLAHV